MAKCRKFLKIQIFNFFRVLLAIKLNSKTYLRSAIFWFRPSFIKKMQTFWLNCSPWPNKSKLEAELRGPKSLGLWAPKFWILWKSKNRFLRNFEFCKVDIFSKMMQVFRKIFSPAFWYWLGVFCPKKWEKLTLPFWSYSQKSLKNLVFHDFWFLVFFDTP